MIFGVLSLLVSSIWMQMNCLFVLSGHHDDNSMPQWEDIETGQKENQYYRTSKNSCQKYVFGTMHDCSNEEKRGTMHLTTSYVPCKNYTSGQAAIVVGDSTGRLGNHIFAYVFLLAVKAKYDYSVYVSRHCHDILAPYFKNLPLPIAEDSLCRLEQVQYSYRKYKYECKIKRLQRMIEREVGYPVALERSSQGQIMMTPEVLAKVPHVMQLIHSSEFQKGIDDYTFLNSTYPWESFSESFHDLGTKPFQTNRALLLENPKYDDSLYEPNFVSEVVSMMDQAFVFKEDLIKLAKETMAGVVKQHYERRTLEKTRRTKAKKAHTNKKSDRSKTHNNVSNKSPKKTPDPKRTSNLIFVGIHSRRGDHIAHQKEQNSKPIKESYFLDAMDMYREKFRNVIFIYVSDDLEWGRQMVGRKARNRHLDIYFVGDAKKIDDRDRDRDSIGHDLALMSLCNHTIISHGTFSYWAGYFAGGLVIRPEHFSTYRTFGVNYKMYEKHPLKHPLPRMYKL